MPTTPPRSWLVGVALVTAGLVAYADSPRGPVVRTHPPRPGPGVVCTRRVEVRQTDGAAGCWIDERVTRAPGLLRYPCAGDGPATVAFGADVFTGRVRGGVVAVALRTRFPFRDGCTWSSTQTLQGRIDAGVLSYRYQEAPLPGQRNCLGACAATGTARLSEAP